MGPPEVFTGEKPKGANEFGTVFSFSLKKTSLTATARGSLRLDVLKAAQRGPRVFFEASCFDSLALRPN
jgi:hypothetical protein